MKTIIKTWLITTMAAFAWANVIHAQTPNSTCHFFLLKKSGKDLALERIMLADKEVKVFQIKPDGESITPIFSIGGPGRSGELVRLDDNHLVIAQCQQAELRVKVRLANGTERELPPRKMDVLAQYDLRVNITGKNIKKVFRLLHNEQVEVDESGPVIDMFGGKVPVGETDYLLTVETYARAAVKSVEGETALEYKGYLFTKASMPGGGEGEFAVDLAASHTVVAKSFLPPTTKLKEASAVQYSEKGKQNVEYLPGGAGGAVKGVLSAEVPELRVGTLTFSNLTVDVLEKLPALGGRQISGIIGLDLLQRAQRISFSYPQQASETARLTFSSKSSLTKDQAVEIPFSIVSGDIMLKGFIGGVPVDFIVDTGSPDSLITSAVAQAAKISETKKVAKPIFGLDGKPIEAKSGTIEQMKLGSSSYSQVSVTVADLPLFEMKGLKQAGLLGNSFFQQFKRVEIDFVDQVIRLQK